MVTVPNNLNSDKKKKSMSVEIEEVNYSQHELDESLG